MTQLYISETTQMITRNGLSARFAASVARALHETLVPIALAKGITAADTKSAPVAPPEDRVPDVVIAIRALMEEGDAKSFSERSGEPNLNPLRKQAGFQVTDAERDAAWAIVNAEV